MSHMAYPAKKERNEKVVKYHDRKKLSFAEIGRALKIGKQTAYDIYRREKARKELSTGVLDSVRS